VERRAATCRRERETAAAFAHRGHGAWALGCALALVLIAWASSALAQVETGRAESKDWRIRISAPEDWRISAQGSYPRVVVWMYRRDPAGTMLLTAERARAAQSSVQYAQDTVTRLQALRYSIETTPQLHAATQASWIEFDDGKTFFRQAFLVMGDAAFALTLSAPDRRARAQHLRAFDSALRSMERIEDPAVDPGSARPAPAADEDLACSAPAPAP
jgi:hypothetical protein